MRLNFNKEDLILRMHKIKLAAQGHKKLFLVRISISYFWVNCPYSTDVIVCVCQVRWGPTGLETRAVIVFYYFPLNQCPLLEQLSLMFEIALSMPQTTY